jgi:hypothetical protein
MRVMFVGWGFIVGVFCNTAFSQVVTFPYVEHFDSVITPSLPSSWKTTTNRSATGDFVSSTSSPRSQSQCLYSQNSTISQSLTSPTFDCSNRIPDKLQFYLARSSTHTSGLLLEASIDNGVTFSIGLSDTIKNPGSTSYVLNAIQLPASLANRNAVRIRWRIVGGIGGSTATFRIDDVSLTTLVSYDLTAVKITTQPALPNSKDSLVLSALIRNVGIQAATGYSVNFSCDLNSNSIIDPNERFASITGPPIAAGDSGIILAGHSPLRPGDYKIFATISLPQDESSSDDTASTTVTIGHPKGSLLVNEFMYAPVGDEPEWIELLNCSPDTVNLRNWRISDNNVTSKSVITTSNLLLPPQGFCIVAKEVSFASYHPSVSCPVIVASFSALNNTTADAVVIYDQRLISIDSVSYLPGWGGQGGKSLERIDAEQASSDSKNWGTSQDSAGSTPGRANSIVRLDYDLLVGTCYLTRVESETGLVSVINTVVHNAGKDVAASYSLGFFFDSNHNGVNETDELIATLNSTEPLNPSDSAHYAFAWSSAPQGESIVLAVIDFAPDQRPRNNSSSAILRTSYSTRSVVVNEIMFDPLANQNEWIELYNRGSEIVDLKNWRFKDRPTASGNVNAVTMSLQPVLLRPGEFAVLAADSTIFSFYPELVNPTGGCHVIVLNQSGGFSLGNDGDDIILKDLTDATIDSVSYSPRWHRPDVTDTKGRSLERINPDLDSNSPYNWTTSVLSTGGTPGKINSSYTVGAQSESNLSFSPNPFSPDGDGYEDFCIVRYHLPFATALLHVKIFDIKGRLVRILANSQLSASSGEIIWDGLDDNRQRVRIGPYVVLIQATDPTGKVTKGLKGVVVVAARL